MSVFLTILAVLTAMVLALEVRRRFRRASGRLGRPRGPVSAPRGTGPLNLDRQASLRGGGRKAQGRGSRRLAGPMAVGLVFVFMGAWLLFSYFVPDAETTAAVLPVAPAAPAPAPTTRVQGGRLTGEDSPAASAVAPSPTAAPAPQTWVTDAARSMIASRSRMDQLGQLLREAKAQPKAAPAKPAAQPAPPKPASAPAPKPKPATEVSAAKPATAAPSPLVGAASGASASAGSGPGILGGGRDFTVHLSSFRDSGNAEAYKNRLAAAGEQAFISETTVNGQHWYRVMSGRFKSREDAANYGRDLKRRDLTADTGQYMIKAIE